MVNLNTFTSVTQEERYPELGEYVGRIQYLSPNQVVTNYGHMISESDKRDLLKSKYYTQAEVSVSADIKEHSVLARKFWRLQQKSPLCRLYRIRKSRSLQDQTGMDFGYRGHFPNQNQNLNLLFNDYDTRYDLIRVVEAYWVSYKRIGFLTIKKPDTGQLVTEVVTDELLKDLINELELKQLRTVFRRESKEPKKNTIMWDYVPKYGKV